jgi:uncharacterized protein
MDACKGPTLSALSRTITRDGWSLEVAIIKQGRRWRLEVMDERGMSSVWLQLFKTEQAALDEALRAIDEEGAAAFSESLPYRDH